MKKLLVILTSLMICMCVFAYTDKPRLLLKSGNDKFTYGISKNSDDQLSFSGDIEFDYQNFVIDLNMEAYTDRGSWPNEEFRNGRLDAVFLDTTYKNKIRINDYFSIGLDKTVGMGMVGKFSFDLVQNFNHKLSGVKYVQIPYDWTAPEFMPIYGIDLGLIFDIGHLEASLFADYYCTIMFKSLKKIALKVDFLDLISAEIGYQKGDNYSKSLTVDSVIESQDGVVCKFGINTVPFMMGWEFYPQTKFGYGSLCIDALSFFRPSNWEHSDAFLDLSLSSIYATKLMNAYARIPSGENLSYLIGVGYVSGFPDNQRESSDRIQRNYAVFEGGVHFSPEISRFLQPFIELKGGVGLFQLDILHNANPSRKMADEILPGKVVFVSDVRCGIELLPAYFLSFGNLSCRIQVYGGTNIVPSHSKLTEVIIKDTCHQPDWTAKLFDPYMGCGINLGIDVPD